MVIFSATRWVKMDLQIYNNKKKKNHAIGSFWKPVAAIFFFVTLHLSKLISAPYMSLRSAPSDQHVYILPVTNLRSRPVPGDTDAGLWYPTWDLDQGCTYHKKKSCHRWWTHLWDQIKSTLTVRKTSALTLLYEQFFAHVAVKYFEEIKWSLSKVVWTPVNHCSIANKINWNNGIAF